jgi:hypothetical protein
MTTTTPAPAEAPDVAAALDMLLADAAVGVARRFRPAQSLLRLAGRPALRPRLSPPVGASTRPPARRRRRRTVRAGADAPLIDVIDDTQPDTGAGTEAPR